MAFINTVLGTRKNLIPRLLNLSFSYTCHKKSSGFYMLFQTCLRSEYFKIRYFHGVYLTNLDLIMTEKKYLSRQINKQKQFLKGNHENK